MSNALTLFPPRMQTAKQRLAAFVPKSGTDYARLRNFDKGPGNHVNVSVLSPYLRARLLDETEVTRAVLAAQTAGEADKFLTEVFWRTYWKGWMELRPTVWDSYKHDLHALHNDVQTQSGLRRRWEAACLGQTGIAPFDEWAHELERTGYLHNHARMWFASIWIFTLDLPWQLGADFFLRHLLDGDAAVNTLSWRWVAGIQTRSKTYQATSDNIAKFTGGRYLSVPDLADTAPAVAAPEPPPAQALAACPVPKLVEPYGLLTHGCDVDMTRLQAHAPDPVTTAYAETTSGHSPWNMAPHVAGFRLGAAQAAASDQTLDVMQDAQAIADWTQTHNLAQIITPYAPVGPTRQLFDHYSARPDAVPILQLRRDLDNRAWPLATKGFFPFRKHIPDLIESIISPNIQPTAE